MTFVQRRRLHLYVSLSGYKIIKLSNKQLMIPFTKCTSCSLYWAVTNSSKCSEVCESEVKNTHFKADANSNFVYKSTPWDNLKSWSPCMFSLIINVSYLSAAQVWVLEAHLSWESERCLCRSLWSQIACTAAWHSPLVPRTSPFPMLPGSANAPRHCYLLTAKF